MVNYDVSLKINDSVLKLFKKSDNVILKEVSGRLVLNGTKDTFYCTVLHEDSFYAEEGLSIVIDISKFDISILEVGDTIRINKYILSIEKGNSKEVITILIAIVKEYDGEIKQYESSKKYDNRLLHVCLKAIQNNVPGGIENVRFKDRSVYINSIFSLIKIDGNTWEGNFSVPYKLLVSGLNDGFCYNDEEGNTVIMNTDVVNYFSASSITDITEPQDEFGTIATEVEFTGDNKNLMSIISPSVFNESKLILSNNVLSAQLKSDNMIINPELKGEKTIIVSSMQIYTLLKLFTKIKFNIAVSKLGNVIRFQSITKDTTVSMYCSGKVE